MIQSKSREKAMLATVSRLRRLLRKADLATKLAIVIEAETFYTAGWRRGFSSRFRQKCFVAPDAESSPMVFAELLPQTELRAAAYGAQGDRQQSPGVPCPVRQ